MKRVITLLVLLCTFLSANAQKNEESGWYVKDYNEDKAKAYFDGRYSLDLIEGIWQSTDGFKYSIEKDVENGTRSRDKYRVIVLESSSNGWNPTQIKGFITYSSVNGIYSMKYYTRRDDGTGLSSQNVLMLVEDPLLISFNRIDGGKISLFKLYPKVTNSQSSNSGTNKPSNLDTWSGSSIVIGDRYVATNYHVVDGAQTLAISGSEDNYTTNYASEVIATDKSIDLAIIKVTDPRFKGFGTPYYGITTSTVDVGTDVFVLGYPLTSTMGQEVKLTTGIISSKTGYQGDVSMYQISAPIQPGNSGGPLFDGAGNLIGIVNAKHTGAENVGYAIKLTYLRNLIESCNDKIAFNYNNSISSLTLAEKVKKITPFVYLVRANYTYGESDQSSNGSVQPAGIEDNKSAQDYYVAARQMLEDKRLDEAYDLVKKSVAASPNKDNHYLRGYLAYYHAEDYDIALESAKYCIENQYQLKRNYTILGGIYYHQEMWPEGIDAYSKLLSLDRKDVYALYMRGLCKSNNGNVEAALADYRAALKFEGLVEFDYGTVYNNIAYQQLLQNDFENAKSKIAQAIRRNHFDGYIWDTYGELMYKTGNYKDCIKYMGAAITCAAGEKNTYTDNSYYYRGLANYQLGYDSDALEDLQKAKELGKTEADSIIVNHLTTNNYNSGKYFNIFKSPKVTSTSSKQLKIRAIESSEEYTTIHFNISSAGGGWYNVSEHAYITEGNSTNKLYLLKAENIAFSPEKSTFGNEIVLFSLTFPAISSNCTSINFYETGSSDGWKLTGIQLESTGEVLTSQETETINWEDVAVTDDPSYADGLIKVDTITKTSGWGGSAATGLGIKDATKKIQKEAASRGCCMIVITNIETPFATKVTADIYKRP